MLELKRDGINTGITGPHRAEMICKRKYQQLPGRKKDLGAIREAAGKPATNDTEPREKGGTGSIQAEVGRPSTPKRSKESENQEALPGPGNYEVISNPPVG